MSEKTYQEVLANIEHYQALGMDSATMGGYSANDDVDLDTFPWAHCSGVRSGGGYVGGMVTGVHFSASFPDHDGFTIDWHVSIEDRASRKDDSGASLHVQRCLGIMTRLPEQFRPQFAAVLQTSADELEKNAADYFTHARHYAGIAAAMRHVAALSEAKP